MVVPLRNHPLYGRRAEPESVVFYDAEQADASIRSRFESTTGNSYTHIIAGKREDGLLHLVRRDGAIDSARLEADGVALRLGGASVAPAPCCLFRPPEHIVARLKAFDRTTCYDAWIEWVRSREIRTRSGKRVADLYFELSPAMRGVVRVVDCRSLSLDVPDAAEAGIVSVGASQTDAVFFESAARCLTARLLVKEKNLLEQWAALGGGVAPERSRAAEEIAVAVGMIASDPRRAQGALLADARMRAKIAWLKAQGYLTGEQVEKVLDVPLTMRLQRLFASLGSRFDRSEAAANEKVCEAISEARRAAGRFALSLGRRSLGSEWKMLPQRLQPPIRGRCVPGPHG